MFKLFWYKVFVHWKLKFLSLLMNSVLNCQTFIYAYNNVMKGQGCLLTMILCSTRYSMMCTSAGSWNRRQRNSMTQCLHCWWVLHSLFQRRWYRTWSRKNMKTTKISSYSDYLSTDPVGNKYHNTASGWSYCCALIVAQFGPHSWWQDICGLVTKKKHY